MGFSSMRSIAAAGLAGAAIAGGIGLVQAGPARTAHVVTADGSVVTIVRPERTVLLEVDDEVHAAVLSSEGTTVALASGEPVDVGAGGVVGDVSVVNADTGAVLARTNFEDATITGLTYSPRGPRVSFVKDYAELWLLDLESDRVTKIADAGVPPIAGSALFDPAFAPGGGAIYVGVVEETFHGEDDKLDNLWRVSLDGGARRVTDLQIDRGTGWKVLRGPTPLPDGRVLVTVGTSGAGPWHAAMVDDGGDVTRIGPVPALTSPVGAGDGEILFKTFDWQSSSFDVYSVATDLGAPSWSSWCDDSCGLVQQGVDQTAVLFPASTTASSSR